MQLWRTISLIRSFQSEKNDDAAEIRATFEDLLVTILLGKKLFREGIWLPSGVQLLEKIPTQSETSVLNPLTGKASVIDGRSRKRWIRRPLSFFKDEVSE
jgi:hypothetical protein